jgi:predicted Zn-ribbon and HTH transcriptional regulator
MPEIKQCWAYNSAGNRCEHPAGHNGDHVIQQTWTDEECSVPGTLNNIHVAEPLKILEKSLVEMPTKCVACGHAHKSSECKCGCHSFIG